MRVVFIHRGGPQMASYRYRAQIPAEQLCKLGHDAKVNPPHEADIVVFSKPCADDVRLAKEVISYGAKVVFDVCDPHFDHPTLGPVYREMANLSRIMICPTVHILNELVKGSNWVQVPPIPDPYEFEVVPPHVKDHNILWFGHQVNLGDMHEKQFRQCSRIVTGPDNIPGTTHYSEVNLKKALSEADYALFPTNPKSYYKTNNRVLNTLNSGVFPICDPHPSYAEFREWIWTSGVDTGIKWAKSQPRWLLNDLVKQAQFHVEQHYSPERIGKLWEQILESI